MIMRNVTIKVSSNNAPPKYVVKLNIEQMSNETTECLYWNRLKPKLATRIITENINVDE